MAGPMIMGPRRWSMTRDTEGHREYKLVLLIVTDDKSDGPFVISQTPGLPIPGTWWVVGNDADLWAWCRPNATFTALVNDEANYWWEVEYTFSTKPPEFGKQRCNDTQIQDPLLEPMRVSGGFNKFTEEASFDRFGNPLNNSAFEPFRGAQVEFDANRPTVRVEQNVALLGLPTFAPMIDCVNDSTLWGCPRRCVKLSNVSWERKFYGTCYVYYTRVLEFEINFNTWDRDVLDDGTKVLYGHWDAATGNYVLDNIAGVAPNPRNPNHFKQFQDRNGENTRVVLNGAGLPAESVVGGGQRLVGGNVSVPTVTSPGSAYKVGDVLSITGGTSTTTATLRVTKVTSGSSPGGVLAVWPLNRGVYSAVPANSVSVTGGAGTGATFDVTWETFAGIPTNIGYAHVEKYPEANFLLLNIPVVF